MASIIQLNSQNLHEITFQKLRSLLVEGAIAPGSKLNERELAEQLNVSRTPIREAIRRLAADGLVELIANRGAIAVQLSKEDVINTFDVIEDFLQSHDLDFEKKDGNTFMVTLPGEKKLQTHCALVVGDHSLSINAFVIRKPDTHEDAVHKWCMAKNAAMYGIAFAINELGDIYLVGRLPLPAVTAQELDRLIGSVLQYSDSSFNPLLELGFADAIRREWAWRVSRGESLANLKAFEHLI